MRALTLWQPWASAVAVGLKSIETRSWPAPASLIGERLAIHAAARTYGVNHELAEVARSWGLEAWRRLGGERCESAGRYGLPVGAVLATARLAGCVPMVEFCDDYTGPAVWEDPDEGGWLYDPEGCEGSGAMVHSIADQVPFGDFAVGRWAWLLEDVVPLVHPVSARGGQRIWNWTVASVLTEGIRT